MAAMKMISFLYSFNNYILSELMAQNVHVAVLQMYLSNKVIILIEIGTKIDRYDTCSFQETEHY